MPNVIHMPGYRLIDRFTAACDRLYVVDEVIRTTRMPPFCGFTDCDDPFQLWAIAATGVVLVPRESAIRAQQPLWRSTVAPDIPMIAYSRLTEPARVTPVIRHIRQRGYPVANVLWRNNVAAGIMPLADVVADLEAHLREKHQTAV